MSTFLAVTEQVAQQDLPGNFRVYEVDGHVIWATEQFRDYLDSLRSHVQDFVDSCPQMENLGDNQDYVITFCQKTGLAKPCYGEWCAGCDEDNDYCSSPDEDWKE